MNRSLRPYALLFAASFMLAGCGKKSADVTVAEERESTLPPEERAEQKPVASADAAPAPGPATEKISMPVESGSALTPSDAAEQEKVFLAWCSKYSLNANDPAMLDSDPDEDGASNRDEFIASTDPTDPKSRPDVHPTMRLKAYHEVLVPVVLESVEGDKAFLRKIEDNDGAPTPVKRGETAAGNFKVERVQRQTDVDKDGNPFDRSNVVLHDPETNERVKLVKGLPTRREATNAVIASADGSTTITVRVGDTFEWPKEPGSQYRVVDLSKDQIVVKNLTENRTLTIIRE